MASGTFHYNIHNRQFSKVCEAQLCHLKQPESTARNLRPVAPRQAYLAYSPSQVPITCSYNIALMLAHPFAQAVISVCAAVCAWQPLDAWILQQCHTESDTPCMGTT